MMSDIVPAGMSDNPPLSNILRDRIAAAVVEKLSKRRDGRVQFSPYDVADAVIATLGLELQSHYDPHVSAHRWVTDWEADNE